MALRKEVLDYHAYVDDYDDEADDNFCGCEECTRERLEREARRADNFFTEWRNTVGVKGKLIGIELELEVATGSRNKIINSMPDHDNTKDGYAPHFEKDSSIHDVRGVEIIFPPVSPGTIKDPTSYINRALASIKDKVVLGAMTRCGMHININTHGWTDRAKGVFVCILHNMPKTSLEKLGGRELNGYCEQLSQEREAEDNHSSYYDVMIAASDYEDLEGDHCYCAELRRDRIECRYPAATVDIAVINRNVAFLEYLQDFSKVCRNRPKTLTKYYELFLEWLENHENEEAHAIHQFLTA